MTTKLTTSNKKWKKIGKIGKAHGLKGAFYLGGRSNLWTDDDASLMSVGVDPKSGIQSLLSGRQVLKGRLILSLESFCDRTSLEAHHGMDLWCLEQECKLEFDYEQLVEFKVTTSCGQTIGKVNEFYNYGASDTIEIVNQEGSVLELPFVEAFVAEIDHKSSAIRLCMNAEAFTDLWQNS
ncbi:MAG: ribosome maturation factor RimM [Oligoflexales bacterium]